MKKFLWVTILSVLMLIAAGCGNDTGNAEESGGKLEAPDKFLQIGTGPMGSGWYPITTVMSEIYMDNFNGLNASQIEGGSTANLKSIDVGDIQLGINYTSDFSDALAGEGGFEEP